MPSPAAGEQLPWDWPPDGAQCKQADQQQTPPVPDETLTSQTPPVTVPPIQVIPPTQDSMAGAMAQQLAQRNWPEILQIGTGIPKGVWPWVAVGAVGVAAIGFGGSAIVVPMLKAWPAL
jgi:hypothetical protein